MSESPQAPLAFERVYREHFSFVWRSLRRLSVRERDVADAVQEVFLVVHRRLGEFEGRAKLSTWLFRICLHVASDHARRAHVRREVLGDTELDELSDPRSDLESHRARREGLRLLEQALAAMSLEQRAVFVLFELEGLTSGEIAEALSLPLGTVYSRLRRARELFQKAIAQCSADRPPLIARRAYDGT